ncbi:hypothetical protein PENTCL1PPCAC_5469, partial [Pristionchus entomophagus]
LGLSYPVVYSLVANTQFAGSFLGSILVPYLIQSLETGTGVCCCLAPTLLSIPMVYAACSALESCADITRVIMITTSLPIFTASYFVEGSAGI